MQIFKVNLSTVYKNLNEIFIGGLNLSNTFKNLNVFNIDTMPPKKTPKIYLTIIYILHLLVNFHIFIYITFAHPRFTLKPLEITLLL